MKFVYLGRLVVVNSSQQSGFKNDAVFKIKFVNVWKGLGGGFVVIFVMWGFVSVD